jgi:hypothetical protein
MKTSCFQGIGGFREKRYIDKFQTSGFFAEYIWGRDHEFRVVLMNSELEAGSTLEIRNQSSTCDKCL